MKDNSKTLKMKKSILNFAIYTLLILFSIGAQATPKPFVNDNSNIDIIRSQFLYKLDHAKDQIRNFSNEVAIVHFTLNSMNEIVILETGTDNPIVDKFIKMELNYERIDIKNIQINSEYFIKILFGKSGISI